ncbi:MAG: hypothetical protein JXM70_30960 [Pirellulales bacterium]|nr:hypothetical protein [Pirellulales bacterium]
MNISPSTSSGDHLRVRAIAGVVVFIFSLGIAIVFSTLRAMAIFELYQKNLRHDVIVLSVARDLSLTIVILSAGFILLSLILNLGKLARVIAVIVLALAVCLTGISAIAERCIYSRVHNNLEKIRRALENYELQRGTSSSQKEQTLQDNPEKTRNGT